MNPRRLWEVVRRYWFDVLVVAGLVAWLADAAVYVHRSGGEQGPLWFDVLAVLAFTTPFLARRRYPAGALVAIAIAIALASFVDGRLVTHPLVSFLFALVICVRRGAARSRASPSRSASRRW